MFQKHGILNIDQIKIFQTSEFMFSFNQGQLPNAFYNYFEVVSEVRSHFTRTANDETTDFSCTNTRRFSLKIDGPNIRNNLPADIRGASNLHLLKGSYKHP